MDRRIMVVDDEALVRDALQMVLQSEGFLVTTFETAADALRASDSFRVGIIDVFMPEMDGVELLSRLRERHPLIGLVAMSGGGLLPGHHVLEDCLLLGAHASLQKPFTRAQLLDAIRAAKKATRMPLLRS